MSSKSMSLDDMFNEVEAEAIAQSKKDEALEKEVWDSLPQAQKDRIIAEREAAAASMWDALNNPEESEEDESEDEEDGADEADCD